MTQDLLKTPLHSLHVEAGAKMVPFAGYDMPVQYALGVKKNTCILVMRLGFLMFLIWASLDCTERVQRLFLSL